MDQPDFFMSKRQVGSHRGHVLKAWSRRDKLLPEEECCSDTVTLFCVTTAGFI